MATEAMFTGRQSRMLIKEEVSFGVAPAGNWTETYFYSSALAETKPWQDDPRLGVPGATARDPRDPAPGLLDYGGMLRVPADLAHIGHWLKLAFGAPETSGDEDFVHVFSSGAAVLPTYAIEFRKEVGEYDAGLGLAARSIRFGMAREAGYRGIELELMGRGEQRNPASIGGAPLPAVDPINLPASVGAVRWNDVIVGKAMAADLTYATGMEGERYLDGQGGALSAVAPLADPSATGTLRARTGVTTLDTAARSDTPGVLELDYALSADIGISLRLARVFLERSGKPIEGPGGVEQSFGFRAAQTTDEPMLVVTLKNNVETY